MRWIFLPSLCKKSQSGFMSIHKTEEDHMKKFLHGHRHLRARRSVQAGREKKFIRKYNQAFRVINRIDWVAIGQSMAAAIDTMAKAAAAMAPILQREVERTNRFYNIQTRIDNIKFEDLNGLS
jgi:hypothetical protein